MEKVLKAVLLLVIMSAAVPVQAQWQWGIRGGVNLAKASFSGGNLKSDGFTGFFIGPVAEFTVPVIGIGADGAVLFYQTGIKAEGETLKRQSVEIPVNLKYNIGLGRVLGVYIAAGPQFGIGLDDDEWKDSDGSSFSFKKTDLSLNLGAGIKLIRHLQAGFTYNIPLGKTAEYDGAANAAGDAFSAKLKTWQLHIAYLF